MNRGVWSGRPLRELSPGTANGLHATELLHGTLTLAGNALAVHAHVGEGALFVAQSSRHGQRYVRPAISGVNLAGPALNGEGEEVGFEHGGAIQAPGSVDDGLDQLIFEDTLGLQIPEELTAGGLVDLLVLPRQNDGLPGESVTECMKAGAFLCGLGVESG